MSISTRRTAILVIALSVIPLALPSQQATVARTGATSTADDERIRPGDVIRLRIWREPEWSGDFAVDEKGRAVFPRLGPLIVSEHSADGLRRLLTEGYREVLINPSIEITLLRRVNILGAVYKPGMYPVDATMSLTDVMALAGGVTPDGNAREVRLLRDDQVILNDLFNQQANGKVTLRSGDQILVPERSWLQRNPYVVVALGTTLLTIISSFVRR